MSLILSEIPLEKIEVFELVLDTLAKEYFSADGDEAMREWVDLRDYDAVVNGLAMALVFFGGLDIEDLCKRVRDEAKGCTYKNMTFPYVWKPAK